MDRGHELTEEHLRELEERIAAEYEQAYTEMAAKAQAYLEQDEEARQRQEERLNAGEITQAEYNNWVVRHELMGQRWTDMRDVLAQDMHNANQIALDIARNGMADVFATNANFATYQIEHDARIDTGLTLYNHDTAEYLLEQQRQLMPGPSTRKQQEIAQNQDMQWNMQKIQSTILQGVLQGETPAQIASRLMGVAQMNYNSAVRYARTMTTSAQNAGRYEGYHRAASVGVDIVVEWQAVLDNRTRHEHRMMHGQRRNLDEPFVITEENGDTFEILYPGKVGGESNAPQNEIWNCRCTLLAWVKGFEGETVRSSPGMGDLTFEEWQQVNAPAEQEQTQEQTQPETPKSTAFDNAKGISDEFKAGMNEALANCGNETAIQLFEHFGDELVCNDDTLKAGAYFSRASRGAYFNAESVAKGSRYERPYEVGFHEFGHMVDWLMGGKTWTYFSERAFDGKTLIGELRSDFKAFKKACGVKRREEVIPILQAENLSILERANLSDILEKMTGVGYPLGYGHGVSYHNDAGNTEAEFFAEVLDSAVTNPESYAQLERVFPNAVELVWNMVRSVI